MTTTLADVLAHYKAAHDLLIRVLDCPPDQIDALAAESERLRKAGDEMLRQIGR